ncbi:hypothetical protein Lalb_Chr12g0206831 [Lupinus albus]|uniref:Uncharacterized protein n=1 Tax=Lupinus albus TaxID=3870 RepID=A0A6A4PNP5_LUPAL|nr:hypothetical protein Lalb_Chr12g0206831 [Lupinus albus]
MGLRLPWQRPRDCRDAWTRLENGEGSWRTMVRHDGGEDDVNGVIPHSLGWTAGRSRLVRCISFSRR